MQAIRTGWIHPNINLDNPEKNVVIFLDRQVFFLLNDFCNTFTKWVNSGIKNIYAMPVLFFLSGYFYWISLKGNNEPVDGMFFLLACSTPRYFSVGKVHIQSELLPSSDFNLQLPVILIFVLELFIPIQILCLVGLTSFDSIFRLGQLAHLLTEPSQHRHIIAATPLLPYHCLHCHLL